jgi:cytoskeleton protein RodZ
MSPFGGWLKHARESRGLTVEALASQTKIPSRHLEALERGVVTTLPAFYQRAEVRAVARAVGLDERLALARLDALLTPVEAPQSPAPEPGAPIRSEHVLAAVGTGVVVALLGWGAFARIGASESDVVAPQAIAPSTQTDARRETSAPPAVQTGDAVATDAPIHPTGPTELVIRTRPEGARVTVNGIAWGISPVTIQHLEPGEKRIRVSMDGYTSAERSVVLDEGRRTNIRIQLAERGL